MALSLDNLDSKTRQLMVEEIERDDANGTLYFSSRLSDSGRKEYGFLLLKAAQDHDDTWLANALRAEDRMNALEQKRKSSGGFTTAKVPVNAPDTLAEGEFNRFYIRGLCRRAIDEGIQELMIVRAKAVNVPRPESLAKIGMRVNAQNLLDDLRANPGVDAALGLPAGPNSGLSIKLP